MFHYSCYLAFHVVFKSVDIKGVFTMAKFLGKNISNGTAHFKNHKQLFEYQHLLLLKVRLHWRDFAGDFALSWHVK
jgi:hypothetical protein